MGEELLAVAAACVCTDAAIVNGWSVDYWHLTSEDVALVVRCYEALLAGGLGSQAGEHPVEVALAERGIPIRALLVDSAKERARITRSDFCELAAAASVIKSDGWPTSSLHMPNVPKGSRAKSESGIDIMSAMLDDAGPDDDLIDGEWLYLASVKHTVQATMSDLKVKLVRSVTTELTVPYVTSQLRVLAAVLERAGVDRPARIFYMVEEFPRKDRTKIHAVAVVDRTRVVDFSNLLGSLPIVAAESAFMRVISVENIETLHSRCP